MAGLVRATGALFKDAALNWMKDYAQSMGAALAFYTVLSIAPLLASAIRLDLPRAGGSTPGAAPASVTVVLDPAGQVFVNDQPLADAALAQRFAALAAQSRATEVQLRADAAVPYGRVVQVLGAAQQAGLSRIGFVTEPAATAAPAGAVPAAKAAAPR